MSHVKEGSSRGSSHPQTEETRSIGLVRASCGVDMSSATVEANDDMNYLPSRMACAQDGQHVVVTATCATKLREQRRSILTLVRRLVFIHCVVCA